MVEEEKKGLRGEMERRQRENECSQSLLQSNINQACEYTYIRMYVCTCTYIHVWGTDNLINCVHLVCNQCILTVSLLSLLLTSFTCVHIACNVYHYKKAYVSWEGGWSIIFWKNSYL